MFEDISNTNMYIIVAATAFGGTLLVLWLYNRREKRRKHAIELASLMNQWGLNWFADAYECYAVGDYSGLVHKVKEVLTAVRSDEAMVAKLWDVTVKVTTYIAQEDPAKAAKLSAILSQSKEPKA